jgi:hypothetical protein
LPASREIGDAVAQPVERQFEGCLRYRQFLLAGASEKVGDVGVEPESPPTAHRPNEPVGVLTAKPAGPPTLTFAAPLPAPPALTGMLAAPRALARKLSFCVAPAPIRRGLQPIG